MLIGSLVSCEFYHALLSNSVFSLVSAIKRCQLSLLVSSRLFVSPNATKLATRMLLVFRVNPKLQ